MYNPIKVVIIFETLVCKQDLLLQIINFIIRLESKRQIDKSNKPWFARRNDASMSYVMYVNKIEQWQGNAILLRPNER